MNPTDIDKAREECLSKTLDRDIAELLQLRMSELSRRSSSGSWGAHIEHTLWAMVRGETVRRFGWCGCDVSEREVADLDRLSQRCGGWYHAHPTLGVVFVPMAAWADLYDASKVDRYEGEDDEHDDESDDADDDEVDDDDDDECD